MHTTLPSPLQMIAYLDRFVHDQARAKRDLATAAYNHYLSIGYRTSAKPDEDCDFGKQHTLLMGPTGSGKTYLVTLLANFLGVPCCIYRANALVKTGYVGVSPEQLIAMVYTRAGYDSTKAERSIVFLDEIDKIRAHRQASDVDVSGEAAQQQLLPLLDGSVVSASDKSTAGIPVDIDTSGMLFIGTGAFIGLPDIVRRRHSHAGRIGFRNGEAVDEHELTDSRAYAAATTDDLIEFGLIPEFIGRFSTITSVEELGVDDYVAILTTTEGSILSKQKRLFSVHGIDLEFTEDAIRSMSEQALRSGTGARGLSRILMKCLDDVDYRLPELASDGIGKIVVTRDTIDNDLPPIKEKCSGAPSEAPAEVYRRAVFAQMDAGHHSVMAIEPDTEHLIATLKHDLKWPHASTEAREWWKTFESDHKHRKFAIYQLLEELNTRKATLDQFYNAFLYSGVENIQCVLHYLDYTMCKEKEFKLRMGHMPDFDEDDDDGCSSC